MTDPKISIVVPIYNEVENIPLIVGQIREVSEKHQLDMELVFVNDGSQDGSKEELDKVARSSDKVKAIHFRRNFGQTAAMSAGFDHARGEVIIPMDGDLQNDPQDIPRLLAKLNEGYDLVSGWRKDRQDKGLSRKLPSFFANRLIAWATGVKLHDYGCTLKAYRSALIKRMTLRGEMHRFLPAIADMVGARVTEIPVNHRAREFGTSKYGIDRTFRVLMDLLTIRYFMRFFNRPMHFLAWPGVICLLLGVGIGFYLSFIKVFEGADIGGRPLLLLSALLVIIGVQFFGLGLLAEMITHLFYSSGQKKPYEIREIVEKVKSQ